MKETLIHFLSSFNELTENQIQELALSLTVIEVKKNSHIVEAGQSCNSCYFLLKGCLRQYVIQDGVEKTFAIYTENQAANYFTDQGTQSKSESYLTCVEDAILLVGNPESDVEIFAKFPELFEITRKMLEADLCDTQKKLSHFITSSPQQRYLNLMKDRPELLQRVPQHIIASYLGMTPESLSRIRKRIATKK